jgi:uncharacterized protein (TIGR02147 family)
MQIPVFTYNSYKELLKSQLQGPENRGRLSEAAEALGCQRPYLSRVLAEELHLTPDHAFNMAEYLNFSTDERDFFLALVEYERASSPTYRNHQLQRITALRKRNESLLDRTKRTALETESLGPQYFSSWLWGALHFLTAIAEYQTTKSLSERLHIKESVVLSHLEQLQERGLVECAGQRWRYKTGGEFHAKKESTEVLMHHQNWRQRAILDAQDFTNDSLHFTAIQTLSRADVARIKELLLEFVARSNEIASPSKPEEAVALICDFFRI